MKKSFYSFLLGLLALWSLYPWPVQAQASPDEFVVLPGDILQITVWKEEGMDREVQVLPDGTISFPLIGTVSVERQSIPQIQKTIKNLLTTTIPDAAITVSVNAPMGHKVSILGQVQKPGEVILNSKFGVMQLISQAGGLTPYADDDKINVIRRTEDGSKNIIAYPYKDISRGRNLDKDIDLKPGDVVIVPDSGLF